jgi:hypothetical protein
MKTTEIAIEEISGISLPQLLYIVNRAHTTLTPDQFEQASVIGRVRMNGKIKRLVIKFDGEEEWPGPPIGERTL